MGRWGRDERSMEHGEVQERSLIEGYVRGTLAGEELEGFEDHLIECGACQEAVAWSEDLRRGLVELVAVEAARRGTRGAALAAAARLARWRMPLAGVAVVAVALAAFWGLAEHRWRSNVEAEVAEWRGRYEASVEQVQALSTRLEALVGGPRGNARLIHLETARGASASPQRVLLTPTTGDLVLAIELGDEAAEREIGAVLEREAGSVAWRATGIEADPYGGVVLVFPPGTVEPGPHRLRLELPRSDGGTAVLGRFVLEIVEAP